jgi:hypothetical protein
MTLSMNQFKPQAVKGMLDLERNLNTVSCEVHSTQSTALVAGQAVKLYDEVGKLPKVVAIAADTDDVFGFVNYSIKDASFAAGSKVEISTFRGNVMYMEASAAISAWANVMPVVSGQKIATATSSKRIGGKALDAASEDGDLVRVLIDLPGSLES